MNFSENRLISIKYNVEKNNHTPIPTVGQLGQLQGRTFSTNTKKPEQEKCSSLSFPTLENKTMSTLKKEITRQTSSGVIMDEMKKSCKRKADSDEESNYKKRKISNETSEKINEKTADRKVSSKDDVYRHERLDDHHRKDSKYSSESQRNKPLNTNFKTHHFPMAGEIYLKMIESGEKKYEGRVNGPLCQRVKIGDRINLFDKRAKWGIVCEVTEKKVFDTFDLMLNEIGEINLLPHLKDKFNKMGKPAIRTEALRVYNSFPGSQRVNQCGCVAIGVKFLNRM